MNLFEFKRNFYRFLNEGKAESFRDAYYPEIDDYILNKIIEIDPESNGDDVSEWGKLLMKLAPTQSDIAQAGEDIAILSKAAKLGTDIPTLGDIKSLEDLHYIAVDIANAKGDMSDEEINSQEESLNCPIVFDDGGFRVLEINTPEAAEHYGKGTMWMWAAKGADGGMFQQLSQNNKIYVIKNDSDGSLYSLIKRGNRVRITDTNDEPIDKTILPQNLISTILSLNEHKENMKNTDTVKMNGEELNSFLYEALQNQMGRILNESKTKQKKNTFKLTESELVNMINESVMRHLNERRYSSDMIVWEMCPYCEEEVEVYGSDREPCCPRCGAHFSLSDEAIEMSITEPYDNGYVVIDGTGAVKGQFERGDYESAIEYANELAIESGLKASFDVYGVERDGYSDSTIIYSTYDNENELRNMMFNK